MTTFLSAALGLGLALLILAMAWIRDTDMAHALGQSAWLGGLTAAVGGHWMRRMILAANRTESARMAEEGARQADEASRSQPPPNRTPGQQGNAA